MTRKKAKQKQETTSWSTFMNKRDTSSKEHTKIIEPSNMHMIHHLSQSNSRIHNSSYLQIINHNPTGSSNVRHLVAICKELLNTSCKQNKKRSNATRTTTKVENPSGHYIAIKLRLIKNDSPTFLESIYREKCQDM